MGFKILQLSDPHTTASHRPLREVGAYLLRRPKEYDAIVLSGDLTQRGHAEATGILIEDIEVLQRCAPVVGVKGNHDGHLSGVQVPGVSNEKVFAYKFAQLSIVALDSNPGQIDAEALTLLDSLLDDQPAFGHVLVMHHPPFPAAMPDLIREDFDQCQEFAKVIEGRVRLILSGHYHQISAGSVAGVPVWSAPALSYQRCVTADLDVPDGWQESPRESSEFCVIDLGETDFQVAHVHLEPTNGGKK
ncbi:MAG: metallophosphoesterase [Actinomycetaceae bacterium]|nr:metallophosphoesterase [Actinomycetaceae bacterium]